MTTGSIIEPAFKQMRTTTDYPGGNVTNWSLEDVGKSLSKSWNGADRPPARRKFTTLTYWLPAIKFVRVRTKNGRFRMKRVELPRKKKTLRIYEDKKRRTVNEEHAYSMSLYQTHSLACSETKYVLDTGAVPPAGMVSRVTNSSSLPWFGRGFTESAVWSANDDIALLGKLREKIAGTNFNMAVFLGEGQEALTMIAGNVSSIVTSIRELKRGNFSNAARALHAGKRAPRMRDTRKKVSADELSSRWLELQYGWLPLLKDVHDGAGYLANRLNAPFVQSYRARHERASGFTKTQQWIESTAVGKTTKQIVARVSEVSEVQLVGLLDPASLVWELLPFSFVADWFIPIGNYLHARALNSALTGTFITTKVVRSVCRFSGLAPVPAVQQPYPYRAVYADVFGFTRHIVLDRTVSASLSVPLPSFKTLGDVPSWKRAANAISLLTQAVIRRPSASG